MKYGYSNFGTKKSEGSWASHFQFDGTPGLLLNASWASSRKSDWGSLLCLTKTSVKAAKTSVKGQIEGKREIKTLFFFFYRRFYICAV